MKAVLGMRRSKWRWAVPALLLVTAAGGLWLKEREGNRGGGGQAAEAAGQADGRSAPVAQLARVRRTEARTDAGQWLMRPVTMAEVQAQFPLLSDAQLRDGRQFIGLDAARVGALKQGDDFALSLPGLPSRQAIVEWAAEEDGMRLIEGSLLSANDRSAERFTLTISSDRSFVVGHLWMGDREYALQVRNGAGWWTRAEATTATPAS